MEIKMFKTPTCGQCPQQIEILEGLDDDGVIEFDSTENVIDATQNMEEANRYSARSFPTTVVLRDDGSVIQQFTGIASADKIKSVL